MIFFPFIQIPDYRNAVIVARDPGSAKKATSYAERLRLGQFIMYSVFIFALWNNWVNNVIVDFVAFVLHLWIFLKYIFFINLRLYEEEK